MVTTVVEGRVQQEYADVLVSEFRGLLAPGLPAEIRESYLVRAADDHELWRIMTVWRSREALEAMRATNAVPPAIRVFRSAHAEPNVRIFDVIASSQPRT